MARQDIPALVGALYDTVLDPGQWHSTLGQVADFCAIANAALVTADRDRSFSSVTSPRANLDCVIAYNRFWWRHDPLTDVAARAPVGAYVSVTDIDREAYFASAFYNEFRRFTGYGNYGLTTTLYRARNAFSTLVLQTSPSRDEIDREARRRIDLIVPHVQRAVSIARTLDQAQVIPRGISASTGAAQGNPYCQIIVTAQGKAIFFDEHAESLLSAGLLALGSDGTLAWGSAKLDAALHQAIESCARNSAERPAGKRIEARLGAEHDAYSIEVVPWRHSPGSPFSEKPAALLLIRRAGISRAAKLARLREKLDLTHAEAGLALEIMKGDGRTAAAARCGISVNTARTHLMHIFQKTGVGRQAELIHVLMGVLD